MNGNQQTMELSEEAQLRKDSLQKVRRNITVEQIDAELMYRVAVRLKQEERAASLHKQIEDCEKALDEIAKVEKEWNVR